MNIKKVFTYVSPSTNHEVANSLCGQLPVIMQPVNSVEELFPLLSNPSYYTDFVCININIFESSTINLDMFDIIHTLSTLIKSTVYRKNGIGKPQRRDTKIFVIVDETTDLQLIRQVMSFPDIVSVGWVLSRQEDFQHTLAHVERLIAGDYTSNQRVLDLLHPKKKTTKHQDTIMLTPRQLQVLGLIQDRGASNKTIARMLGLSESTVKLHMGAIFKKYGVKSRTQLAVFARDQLKSTVH